MRNLLHVLLCAIAILTNSLCCLQATEHMDHEILIRLPIQVRNYLDHLPKIHQENLEVITEDERAKRIVIFLKEFYPQRKKSGEYFQQLVGEEKFIHKIQGYLQQSRMIPMRICGFPFKSTNTEKKVLGSSVDMAEFVSILTLYHICSEISILHPLGARVTIISDGIIFKDILRISDYIFSDYQQSLKKLIDPFSKFLELKSPTSEEFRRFREESEQLLIPINTDVFNDMTLFSEEELDCNKWKFDAHTGKSLIETGRSLTGGSLAEFLAKESAYFSKFMERYLENYSEYVHLNVHPHKDISHRCSLDLFYRSFGTPWHLTPVFTAETVVLEKRLTELKRYRKAHPESKAVLKPGHSLLSESCIQNLKFLFYLREKNKYEEDLAQRVHIFVFNDVALAYFLR
jgi:pyoverdine/dityrosine biosynthesis protein Dit1